MKLNGSKVRWYRDRLGWTLDVLAEKAEVAKGTVLRAEHEEDIRPISGRRIAQALGVEIPDLILEMPGATSPKEMGPLSPEWAHRVDPYEFQLRIREATSEQLRELGEALAADFSRARTRLELLDGGPAPDVQRARAFSLASVVNEELDRRGKEPLQAYVLAFRRFDNATTSDGVSEAAQKEDQEHRAG